MRILGLKEGQNRLAEKATKNLFLFSVRFIVLNQAVGRFIVLNQAVS